mmetsp:Transcript_19801/g.26112  ORF Transcript_19801/g.26112 Transcript_19801/m.26112 type:complete len:642 (-) Transcript_19801:295-2220(-)
METRTRMPTINRLLVVATVSAGFLLVPSPSEALMQPMPVALRNTAQGYFKRNVQVSMMADPSPGSREDEIQSKIELLRSAKKKGAGYEKFLEKSKGQTLTSTLKELESTDGGKLLSSEELKMKKDKELYKDAVQDVSVLNTGKFRRNLSQENLDNRDLFVDPDAYKEKYESEKKTGEEMVMEDYENLMADSENFFSSSSNIMGTAELQELVQTTQKELDAAKEKEGQTTSGVGGNWSGQNTDEVEKMKPKVGTWGVFERPKDISKAYGGGRRIGVGGYQMSPEERQRKDEETRALLDEVLNGNSEEKRIEEEHAEEIDRAVARASQLMRFGDRYGALEELGAVKDWLNPKSERGGRAYLEYGLVLEAAGNQEEALSVYRLLVSKCKLPKINKNAKALANGIEAFTSLNFNVAEQQSQWIWDFPEIETDVRYETKYFKDMDADGMPASGETNTLKGARFTLLKGIEYKRGISQSRIVKAISFLASRSKELLSMEKFKEEIPESWKLQTGDLNTIPERLNGTWSLGLTLKGQSVGYPETGFLEVAPENNVLQSCIPYGLASLERQGTYTYEPESRELNPTYSSSKLLAGLFAAPWSSSVAEKMEVVLLDDELCVTREISNDQEKQQSFFTSTFLIWKKDDDQE